jgi:hypothetical protein
MVATCARGSLLTLLLVVGMGLSLAGQAAAQDAPVSLERIRSGIEKPPAIAIDVASLLPVATFRTSIDQPVFVLTLEERLRKEFALTAFQRQSSEWGAKCCGLNLGALYGTLSRALQEQRERRAREEVARELKAQEVAADRR